MKTPKMASDKQKYAVKVVEKELGIKFDQEFTAQNTFLWLRENVPKAQKQFVDKIKAREKFAHLQSIEGIISIPLGVKHFESEITPDIESLDMRIAIDSILLNIL